MAPKEFHGSFLFSSIQEDLCEEGKLKKL